MTIRVVLVDDQPLLLRGFRLILGAEPDIEVVGEGGDGETGVAVTAATDPDIVLMDVRMPGIGGIEATRRITAAHRARVVILTTFDLDEYAVEALLAGASGFLLKDAQPADLTAGIRAVASGDAVLAPSTTRRLLVAHLTGPARDRGPASEGPSGAPVVDPAGALTQREREVFAELAEGLTNAEIATRLVLSEATVKTHVARVLMKLGVRDRVQAVIFAYRNGLAPRSR